MKWLTLIQIITAILLMASILMQNRGAGLSGVFGGGDNFYRTKRGAEKILFRATVILAVIFVLIPLIELIIVKK